MANHLAMGITVGSDGLGLDLALPFSPFVQFRTGYSIFPYSFKKTVDLEEEFKDQGLDLGAVAVWGTLWKSGTGKVLLDIFPGRKTGFRFTLGAYVGVGKVFNGKGDLTLHMEEDEYASRVIAYNNISFTTDPYGYVQVDARSKTVIPYVGVGYGRAIKPGSRVRLSVDLGTLITGGLTVQTYDFRENKAGEPVIVHSSDLRDPASGCQLDNGWFDKISKFSVLPLLRFNVYILLF